MFYREETEYICPCCKKPLYKVTGGLRCTNQKCGFAIWDTIPGHTLTEEEKNQLLAGEETDLIEFYSEKKKKHFNAKLTVNKRKKKVEMVFE